MDNANHTPRLPKGRLFRILSWVFIVIAIVLFYISLRSPYDAEPYTIVALAVWAIAFAFHKLAQRENRKPKNKEE